jgi:cell division protein FtsI (penicillin-binding protein 3)
MATKRECERGRVVVVVCGFALLFVVVAVRAGQLTMVHGQRLAGLARQQQHRTVELAPVRGPIVDRMGETLALTIDAESLYAHPDELRSEGYKMERLAAALGMSTADVRRKAEAKAPFVWLKRLAEPREVEAVEALATRGVGTLPERRRVYPRGSLAVHVLGFSGIDAQGLEGVERFYDDMIRPPAHVVEVGCDAHGRNLVTNPVDPGEFPIGARVELTLDAALQAVVERELALGVSAARAAAGTAVVLDTATGAVLAVANVPSFDPNNVAAARPAARRNRAVTDVYEPGSTFKAILAAAALDVGVAKDTDQVFCEEGRYRVGRRTVRDHHPHGWLSLAEVVQYSSNIGTTKFAQSVGNERFHAYVRAFGFGEKTGIDLPGEVPGMLRPVAGWTPIDLATASFGQGLAVTPLQIARAFAAIANGGEILRPFIVSRVVAADGRVLFEQKRTVVRRVVRRETAQRVTAMLRRVVEAEGGTGHLARLPGVAVAGKTGTSQKVDSETGRYSPTARVASFVGFVPADAPRVVVAVVVDEPRSSPYGGVVAAPVFREISGAIMGRMGVEQSTLRNVQGADGRGRRRGGEDPLDAMPRAGVDPPGAPVEACAGPRDAWHGVGQVAVGGPSGVVNRAGRPGGLRPPGDDLSPVDSRHA